MPNKEVFLYTREEWLQTESYIFPDLYSDEFAINFKTVTNGELIEQGVEIEEPIFKREPFELIL